jgi:hypothetical protein
VGGGVPLETDLTRMGIKFLLAQYVPADRLRVSRSAPLYSSYLWVRGEERGDHASAAIMLVRNVIMSIIG